LARGEGFETDGAGMSGSDSFFFEASEASASGEAAVSEEVGLVGAVEAGVSVATEDGVAARGSIEAAEALRLGMACLRSAETIETPEMRKRRAAANANKSFGRKGRFHQKRAGPPPAPEALELERKGVAAVIRAKG
jgi:hypothetical protein